jgi:nicotinamidase-related amidase
VNEQAQTANEPGLGIALMLVDVINGFDFHDSDELVRAATEAVPNLAKLAESARLSKVPVIYVNDNFGMWQSDFRAVAEYCMRPDQPGRDIARRMLPEPSDYFVLKPRHSGFLGTPLEALLGHLRVNVIVLAGFATDLCVLFTALDAHARGFRLIVAADATAANDQNAHRTALTLLERTLHAPIVRGADVDWQEFARAKRRTLF